MANALSIIHKEAKRIRAKHPKKHRKWTGYVKEAAQKYNKGAIGSRPKKKKVVKKKTAKPGKKKAAVRIKRTVQIERTIGRKRRRRRTSKAKHYKPSRRRSVGGLGSNNMLTMLALGVGGYLLFKSLNKPTTPTYPTGYQNLPQLSTTQNYTRDTQSQNLVNYAIAAGYAAEAISSLIQMLNSSSDSKVQQVYDNVNTTGNIGVYLA